MALVDVVVLVHDKSEWADLCVRSVESFTKNPYRLIIVDSASKEEKTKKWFEEVKGRGHTVIHLAENRSFSEGVNAGVSAGDSKFIILLNDDAVVTEGWDSSLLQDASDKYTGLVGARSNYASGAQGMANYIGEPPYLVFVCVALRREIWNIVGPMDSITFDGFSSEDIDYAWRVKKAGYKLKVSNAYVLHAGSRTLAATIGAFTAPGQTTEARIKNDQKYNARLIDKWGKDWVKEYSVLRKNGVVVTYHMDEWTRVEFLKNLINLRASDVGFSYLQVCRMPISLARNTAADWATDNGMDWMVQLDDDATFPPDLLRRLLSHQKDVVCALAYQRKVPHGICCFELGPDGMFGAPMEGIEHTGLRRVDVSGFHCSVINTSVFKKMREGIKDKDGNVTVPGTRNYFGGFDNKLGEDFAFSVNLKKYGIQMYVDTELISGHIGASIVVDEGYKRAYVQSVAPR